MSRRGVRGVHTLPTCMAARAMDKHRHKQQTLQSRRHQQRPALPHHTSRRRRPHGRRCLLLSAPRWLHRSKHARRNPALPSTSSAAAPAIKQQQFATHRHLLDRGAATAAVAPMQQQAAQRAPHCGLGHPAIPLGSRQQHSRARRRLATPVAAPDAASTSGRELDYAPTPQPASPGFLQPDLPPVEPWVRPEAPTYMQPSVRESGTLRPQAEWYPAWMRYRRREDNYVFWQDKFSRCSLDIPAIEKRWTVFSTFWYLVLEFKYFAVPPAVRYLFYRAWRSMLQAAYNVHKALVLWQAKVDAGLASRATGGAISTFSRAMTLRRLHWRNSLLAELLYAVNVYKTGRVHMLPPVKKPFRRPTFFFLF